MIATWRGLEEGISALLRLYGWRWMHQRPAQTQRGWRTALEGDPGFPDFLAARRGRLLFIEAKSGRGRLSPAQVAWREAISLSSCAEYHLWGRDDLESGKVQEVLR